MLHGMGVRTDVDIVKLLDAVDFIASELGRELRSNIYRAKRA